MHLCTRVFDQLANYHHHYLFPEREVCLNKLNLIFNTVNITHPIGPYLTIHLWTRDQLAHYHHHYDDDDDFSGFGDYDSDDNVELNVTDDHNHSLLYQLLFAGEKFWYHGKQKYSQISQLIQNHLKLNWVSLSLQSHIIKTNDICMESVRRVALVNELWGPLWWKSIDNTSLVQLGKLGWSPDNDMFEPIGLLCPCLSRHLAPSWWVCVCT